MFLVLDIEFIRRSFTLRDNQHGSIQKLLFILMKDNDNIYNE